MQYYQMNLEELEAEYAQLDSDISEAYDNNEMSDEEASAIRSELELQIVAVGHELEARGVK